MAVESTGKNRIHAEDRLPTAMCPSRVEEPGITEEALKGG